MRSFWDSTKLNFEFITLTLFFNIHIIAHLLNLYVDWWQKRHTTWIFDNPSWFWLYRRIIIWTKGSIHVARFASSSHPCHLFCVQLTYALFNRLVYKEVIRLLYTFYNITVVLFHFFYTHTSSHPCISVHNMRFLEFFIIPDHKSLCFQINISI